MLFAHVPEQCFICVPLASPLGMCSTRSSLLTPGAVASAKTYPASHSKSDLGNPPCGCNAFIYHDGRLTRTSCRSTPAENLQRCPSRPACPNMQLRALLRYNRDQCSSHRDLVGAVDSCAPEKLAAFLLCQAESTTSGEPQHLKMTQPQRPLRFRIRGFGTAVCHRVAGQAVVVEFWSPRSRTPVVP